MVQGGKMKDQPDRTVQLDNLDEDMVSVTVDA